MDLATLDIDPEQAATELRHYEQALARERNAEDEAIAAGYRACARGLRVISLSGTLSRGGWFDNGLPRLAVCRADARECWVHVTAYHRAGYRTVTFTDRQWDRGRAAVGRYRVQVDLVPPRATLNERRDAHTLVPLVPPQHRPNGRRQRLHRYHVLWEVEQWTPVPPHDPALLRHIRGDLWAVVAVWDLTPLERAVLSARADA